eukprot:m.381628 g.381628  ORF g.381628 m.381628 type:complete len:63 (-) comp20043_c0_seq2:3745-3933(-)
MCSVNPVAHRLIPRVENHARVPCFGYTRDALVRARGAPERLFLPLAVFSEAFSLSSAVPGAS